MSNPNPDFDRRVYTACQEVRQGDIGEIEVEEVTTSLDGTEVRITFIVRKEVKHFHLGHPED